MSLKDTEGIVGTQPGVYYFVQEEPQWYSNEVGKLIECWLDNDV